MSKEEFNLSDRIDKVFGDAKDCWYHKQTKKEIKEFIRLLKEEIERGVKRNNIFPLDWCFDSIDKLAGEKLVK